MKNHIINDSYNDIMQYLLFSVNKHSKCNFKRKLIYLEFIFVISQNSEIELA